MKKYLTVLRISLSSSLEYRWNFWLGQLRQIILLLTLYYLWSSAYANQAQLFGFNFQQIITYLLVSQFLRVVILDSRSDSIGAEIAGDSKFFAYLLRPIGYLRYHLFVDLADKIVKLIFIVIELFLFAWVFHLNLIFQNNLLTLALFLLSAVMAYSTFFYLSSLVGFWAFWTSQTYGARFALGLFLEFISGAFFPLDALPKAVLNLINLTPFPYLVYFPVKLYLGQLTLVQTIQGLVIQLLWLLGLWFGIRLVWNKGLKVYAAFGG